MKSKKKRRVWFLSILAFLLVLLGIELWYSNMILTVSRYQVFGPKVVGDGFRIVFLSDLHRRGFGSNNSRLLKKIKEQNPDLIAFVGDMIDEDADQKDVDTVCELIRNASEIAPVYYTMGNHEYSYMDQKGTDLSTVLAGAGATVLDNMYLDLEICETPVRIGGYMGYYRTPHMNTSDGAEQMMQTEFCVDFENTTRFKLLLNHIPTGWLDWNYRDKYPVDLVLSGHYHGGVIRIPLLEQGLYAPYVGWWPPYTKGMFVGKEATCILTTGLAGYDWIPRIFNPPEIVVVDVR